jgi:hypothetical protein
MLDNKALPQEAEGATTPSNSKKSKALKRERVEPQENPEIVEGRQKQREEALENLFSFLHTQK